jgi:acyl-CoA synthetase (AMP-forming)/AMP-acid ligase II
VNLVELLHASVTRYRDRPAITDVRTGRSRSYGDVVGEVERVKAFLAAQGVVPGQRIGLLAPNGLAYLPASFGVLSAGACLVPLASNLTPSEVSRILGEVEVNGCLCWPGATALPGESAQTALPDGECAGFWFQWIDRGAEGPGDLRRLNPAFIRFTSGTTASAKGVVLSHEATAARVEAADRVLRLSAEDRILWVLPLAYHFAVTVVAYVRAGAHILMCPDSLPVTLRDAMRQFGASVFYASPLHFERLGHLRPGGSVASLRLAMSTSAPIPAAVIDRFEMLYGVPVGQAYGIIEAGLVCINARKEGLPPTSLGRPVPGYEVAAFSDDGARRPPGIGGEIGVRGAGLFSAYYAPWRRREEITRDGWFLTGDVGRIDADGALHLQGRKKAIIFVAGLKFFPEEVEECINRFPGIRESRVFGESHDHLGQVPRAEIVVEPAGCDVDALRAHCARELSSYKVPLEFTVVPALPRTPGGKILRQPMTRDPGPVSGARSGP